jgi:hypothetical protein
MSRSSADGSSRFCRLVSTSIRYGDSIACTSVERRKAWYGGDTGSQIWPLLERQKSQQKNPGTGARCAVDMNYSY